MHLGYRGPDVRHVLEHLDRQRRIERRVCDGQRRGVGLMERHVVVPLGALRRHGEHRRRGIDTRHRSLRPHPLEQLGHVEPGAAADIENVFAGLGGECVVHQTPSPQDIASAIEDLQVLGKILVELELCHGRRYC